MPDLEPIYGVQLGNLFNIQIIWSFLSILKGQSRQIIWHVWIFFCSEASWGDQSIENFVGFHFYHHLYSTRRNSRICSSPHAVRSLETKHLDFYTSSVLKFNTPRVDVAIKEVTVHFDGRYRHSGKLEQLKFALRWETNLSKIANRDTTIPFWWFGRNWDACVTEKITILNDFKCKYILTQHFAKNTEAQFAYRN